MLLTLKFIGLQAAWWGCGAAYLSSDRQLLAAKPIGRAFGWGGFALGGIVAVVSWTMVHDIVTACSYWTAAVMVSWALLVLATPHTNGKLPLFAMGTVLMLVAAVLG